jgi:hypothetical protein
VKKTSQTVARVFALCYLFSMRPLESLTLESIVGLLSDTFQRLPDPRHPDRIAFQVQDTLLSGFACMFFQHPSLLQFQRRMKERRGRCNLETIFGVCEVPSDSQMREILDPLPCEPLRQLLPTLFEKIRRAGWAKHFKTQLATGNTKGEYYCVALDGTQYFHSTKLECPSCLVKTDQNGQAHYSHAVVAATLVKAGSHKVLPMDVEQVQNSDGEGKQDCELNAAKRLVKRLRAEHRQMTVIVTGDDLYSHEPFVELLESRRFHYVIVAKAESHKEMFEWVEEIERMGESTRGQWQEGPACARRWFEYRIIREVPLSASRRVAVTLVEVWERDRKGKLLYHNSWITDLEVDTNNIAEIVAIGRSRWKIENEQFNVQKNSGYELEHSYGHGKKNLSQVFYLLNLLAYLTHRILEMGDRLYQKSRQRASLRELWGDLRSLMKTVVVESWQEMLLINLDEEAASP